MPRIALLPVGLLLVAPLVGAGCGRDDERADATPGEQTTRVASTPAQESPVEQLAPFLMRKGEEPGFRPVDEPQTIVGVDALLGGPEVTPADAKRLRRLGFVASIFQPTTGPSSAGVTTIDLFETADGARRSVVHELDPRVLRARGLEVGRRFSVSGVPGGGGWIGRDLHDNRIGHVLWPQGRCLMLLGNEGPSPSPKALSTGAQAIYRRTGGKCP